jgi:hypothetical protein
LILENSLMDRSPKHLELSDQPNTINSATRLE